MESRGEAVIIGAGPAGLTAAYCLSEAGWKATVLEADPEYVGGDLANGRLQRLSLRYRRPPVLLQIPRGGRVLE